MRKHKRLFVTIWSLLHITMIATAQFITIDEPTINFTGNVAIVSVTRTIENPTDSAIPFIFPDLPQTDSQFLADSILSAVVNPMDTEQSKEKIVQACGRQNKNPHHYVNTALIFGSSYYGDTLLFAREHTPIGRRYSTYTSQCGNSSDHTMVWCMMSGYFKLTDFRCISVENHTFTETKLYGRFALTDSDVGTCGFMFHNPASPNGWASFADIRADTTLVNERYVLNGEDVAPKMSLSDYRIAMVTGTPIIGSCLYSQPISLTGEFILPAHAKVTTSPFGGLLLVDVNVTDTAVMLSRRAQIINDCQNFSSCIDSMLDLAQEIWPFLDRNQAWFFVDNPSLGFYNGITDQGLPIRNFLRHYKYPPEERPYWLLETHSLDTIVIGRDLKAPLFVLEIANGMIGDTNCVGGAVFPLWDTDTVPKVTHREVNYLQNGFLEPGNQVMKLSVNANVINPLESWRIQGGPGLVLDQSMQVLGAGPLPVQWAGIRADAMDNSFIRISWSTALEINNAGFVVMRSTDGIRFDSIGYVYGNNNSTVTHDYFFDDAHVSADTVYYYRLKQVDFDGATALSSIVSMKISGVERDTWFTVYDLMGRKVLDQVKPADLVPDKIKVPFGVYISVGNVSGKGKRVPVTTNNF